MTDDQAELLHTARLRAVRRTVKKSSLVFRSAGVCVHGGQRGPLSGLGFRAGRSQRVQVLAESAGGRHLCRLPEVSNLVLGQECYQGQWRQDQG